MDASIGWQKAMQDLAGDNEEIREQLREITSWFPSIEMMRNHARGLIKVMREDEKVRAFPTLRPTFAVILWAMRGVQRSTKEAARRWWMYRSLRIAAWPDPTYCLEGGEGHQPVLAAPNPRARCADHSGSLHCQEEGGEAGGLWMKRGQGQEEKEPRRRSLGVVRWAPQEAAKQAKYYRSR
ncbi:hypothetical protein ZWY2020_028709 [Hordeum vulgare]|nr:hypothetical protein ZWY2020_028709 [Hordeum vulgare]